ncbi:MAG TPA: trypsin-like peptidase domain-containing protein [Kofleriaceae bacterium]|nr:trypsin-like peptidase domain-containing protein [Kofleriaceae bacterium]
MVYPPSYEPSTPPPSRGPTATTRWLSILLLVVAGALVFTVVRDRQRSEPEAAAPAPEPRAITPRGDLSGEEQSTIELFKTVSQSVVHVTSVDVRRSRLTLSEHEIPQGTGSGFLWDSEGHVVTNFHVIQGGSQADVTLRDNTVWKAKIVGVAEDKDLAVLQIVDAQKAKPKLRPIAIGTSNNLEVGQKVFAIGNPFGLDQTLTTGVISGLGREIQSVTRRPIRDVIQTDAAINPGNSGGPLLDSAGRVIGINTAIYSPSGAYAGIGFAVPVDMINLIVPELIAHGRVVRPGLGIQIAPETAARQLNLKGVLILEAQDGGAAARAGLVGTQKGPDGGLVLGDLIVAMNDQAIEDVNDLYRELDKHKVGDTVTLGVERRGAKRDVKVTLQALPPP